nr:retrovirus-related Pol polyprotein from transposon TNT 1-94 [Tanacetum cinerariifolium]
PQLDNDDLKQIDVDDLEEIDLKWQMAMLTVRARRFFQRTGRNLRANRPTSMGFDMSKVECYNYHRKGHFVRECMSPKDTRRNVAAEPHRRNVPVETSTSNALVSQCDDVGSYDWSFQIDLKEKSLDDLFNSLKIYEGEAKSSFSASTSTQNIAFVSSQTIDGTNDPVSAVASVSVASAKNSVSAIPNVDTLSNAVECYNCHKKGHFVRECMSPKDTRRNVAAEPQRRNVLVETSTSNALVSQCDDVGSYDWSFQAEEEPTNYALMTLTSSSSFSSDNKAEIPQNAPSFVQPNEQVKTPRPSVKLVETSIPAANHKTTIPKLKSHRNSKNRKACFVCKSLTHLIKDSVLTKSKLVPINVARPVTAATPKPHVTRPRQANTVVTKPHSPPRRHINRSPSPKASTFPPKVTSAKAPMVNVVKGKWEWTPKCLILDHGNPHHALKDKGVIDSGCSRHMTGNMSYLSDFEEINGGYVAFGGNPKGGKISGKGKIRTGKLDFDDVYFVKELKFNLFSVSQMCDKKNSALFTDTKCIILSLEFKLLDENQVLLRVPRKNNMYNVDLKNIIPSGDFTCLFTKATLDESNLWHRRLGHINFKTMNKLVKGIENQLSLNVKIIRSDNGTGFKNNDLNQFCGMKGIKREFSVPRTPQQNRIAERKNKTLIETARTMLADSLLPILFWAEAVNTACYVQNRVLVTKPQNKTPYELLLGRIPSIGFMRPFGCPVTIFNTLDPLGKFDGNVDEGFLVGYSLSSKAFRVFNSRTRIVQKTLHINFLENKPNVVGSGPTWLFDIDTLTKTMNYQPVIAGNQSNPSAGVQEQFDNTDGDVAFEVNEPKFKGKKPESEVHVSPSSNFEDFSDNSINEVNVVDSLVPAVGQISTNSTNTFSSAGPSNTVEELLQFKMQKVWVLVDLPNGKRVIGTKWVFRNKKDERGIVVKNKARLVAQGHTQEEGIDYEEVFAPAAMIEAIRLFLAYASFMGFMVYQIDVKSAFLYGTIEEEFTSQMHYILVANGSSQQLGVDFDETFSPVVKPATIRTVLSLVVSHQWPIHQLDVKNAFLNGDLSKTVYMHQPPSFVDSRYPHYVCLLHRSLYGLKQAPRAWFQRFAGYATRVEFYHSRCDSSMFIYRQGSQVAYLFIYVDDIILTALCPTLLQQIISSLNNEFNMTDLGTLNYFLGISANRNPTCLFLSQKKYALQLLERFHLVTCNPSQTPVDIESKLGPKGAPVQDPTLYRSLAGGAPLSYFYTSKFVLCSSAYLPLYA